MAERVMRARGWPVGRWVAWSLVAHHVVWIPVTFLVLAVGVGRLSGNWIEASLKTQLWIFVLGAPVTLAFTVAHALVLRMYVASVRRDPALEGDAMRLARNCGALAVAAVMIALIAVVCYELAMNRRAPWRIPAEWGLIAVPIVVGFVNLLVPRLVVPSLRCGTWPGLARDA